MRRVEIKQRGSLKPARILELIEDVDGELLCKDEKTGREYVYAKSISDIRFLSEEENKKFGNTEQLTKQVFSEVLQLRHDCDDVIKELTKKVEKLELEMKATVCAFANLGIPTSPARIDSEPPQPTYTREEAKQAFIAWQSHHGEYERTTYSWEDFLSELDRVKEVK